MSKKKFTFKQLAFPFTQGFLTYCILLFSTSADIKAIEKIPLPSFIKSEQSHTAQSIKKLQTNDASKHHSIAARKALKALEELEQLQKQELETKNKSLPTVEEVIDKTYEEIEFERSAAISSTVDSVNNAYNAAIATVAVKKANVRAGAGLQHSPIMTFGFGSKLQVIENGLEWIKILTPSGEIAWISRTVVQIS